MGCRRWVVGCILATTCGPRALSATMGCPLTSFVWSAPLAWWTSTTTVSGPPAVPHDSRCSSMVHVMEHLQTWLGADDESVDVVQTCHRSLFGKRWSLPGEPYMLPLQQQRTYTFLWLLLLTSAETWACRTQSQEVPDGRQASSLLACQGGPEAEPVREEQRCGSALSACRGHPFAPWRPIEWECRRTRTSLPTSTLFCSTCFT